MLSSFPLLPDLETSFSIIITPWLVILIFLDIWRICVGADCVRYKSFFMEYRSEICIACTRWTKWRHLCVRKCKNNEVSLRGSIAGSMWNLLVGGTVYCVVRWRAVRPPSQIARRRWRERGGIPQTLPISFCYLRISDAIKTLLVEIPRLAIS